ncbi:MULTISPECIES: DUF6691 family protein [unclassified Iodidimonas]|jgi:uncharacterized membrane protein YedE/YeeE|uniref:DUF6691 family protein n=1 Tax=unclassified Iodidimonas TaxID=2626145 RepID=UPI0024830F91|nr:MULTISPECIES: DUF6691 family protein [unclassified Iodidimonas]
MMGLLLSLLSGLIFGAGLAISGMADPARVQAFLDIFGAWDPTLAFVMGGAMIPMAIAWKLRKGMKKPLAAGAFDLPGTRQIDKKLALGALFFGVGWGISGLCPGPALADLAIAPGPAAIFIGAMLGGMALHKITVQ